LAVLFVKFSFYYFLCNVGFLKKFSWYFYYCCNLKLQFGPIFEILTFDFPRKQIFFKSPISQDSLIGKFQNWVEMKVNYPNNKRNTQMDFSDNFHNIKNFVQVDHFENISKNLVISSFDRSRKTTGGRKIFAIIKNECI
jgi:hypothetical protein